MGLRVLSVASECAPFVKTGGLADVVGALAKALAAENMTVRILLPLYPQLSQLAAGAETVAAFPSLMDGPARLLAARAEGLDLLLLDAPHLYDRPGRIYLGSDGRDWADNHLRFGALSRAGAEIALGAVDGWTPDIVHAHDWQAGLVPVYLRQSGRAHPPGVLTIHNIAFQGLFPASEMAVLGLSADGFTPEGFEYWGRLSFLKGGLTHADRITTVSHTYARELATPEFGMGLDGVISARRADMAGILNGIDTGVWNPETDPHLPAGFTARKLKGKSVNKAALEARFGLSPDPDAPLFAVISRLTEQKGLDLVAGAMPGLAAQGGRLVVLGTGDAELEAIYSDLARAHPDHVGVEIGYDEALAHLMQAGADAIIVPSRFEPCGLTQLCALRYGTIPVVSRTGGLADTVIDANPAALSAGCATGIQFAPVTGGALTDALDRCVGLYDDRKLWTAMVRRAMKQPVGWERSAAEYAHLYRSLVS